MSVELPKTNQPEANGQVESCALTVRDWSGRSGVLIYGMFGGWNAGDEAILYSVVEMLRDSGFDKRFTSQ